VKLLVLTQAVDRTDAVLGFFHSWLEALAQEFESITAVGLQKGDYELPSNVKVLSLGKEESTSRVKYITRFFRYVWQERDCYDAVFVHMTPIYIILAGTFWKLKGKKVLLWYNHQHGNFLTKLAISLSEKVLYTSPYSFCARFPNAERMPAGINTAVFKNPGDSSKMPNSILSLGRISPVKKLHHLIEAAGILEKNRADFVLDIIGSPIMAGDRDYEMRLKESAHDLINKGMVRFYPAVRNDDAPRIYTEHELFVNLSPPGLFDKTILEAMGCETLVLVTNPSFSGVLPEELLLENDDPEVLARRIFEVLHLSADRKLSFQQQLRSYVSKNHGLPNLVEKIGKMLS
jgi:glycosyltransferase involved in cell wall biosynthesis